MLRVQNQIPLEATLEVLDTVRPTLHDPAWGKLARAPVIPLVPGLVGA